MNVKKFRLVIHYIWSNCAFRILSWVEFGSVVVFLVQFWFMNDIVKPYNCENTTTVTESSLLAWIHWTTTPSPILSIVCFHQVLLKMCNDLSLLHDCCDLKIDFPCSLQRYHLLAGILFSCLHRLYGHNHQLLNTQRDMKVENYTLYKIVI